MIVIRYFIYFFIFLFLLSLSIPNFVTCGTGGHISSVKANTHTLQTVLETYAVDWGGQYDDFESMKLDAKQKNYWKDFKNPYNAKDKPIEKLENLVSIDEYNGNIYIKRIKKGTILYDSSSEQNIITKYYLYAVSKEDNKLIVDKGQVFCLSNS